MNQQIYDNAAINREKLNAVQALLNNATILASGSQDFQIDLQGTSDVLKTLAFDKNFAQLADVNYTDLIAPLNVLLKNLVINIKGILDANVITLNNEFQQL